MTPLAVAETDRIAALLAEVMPEITPPAHAADAPVAVADPDVALGAQPMVELLGRANWRNEPPDGETGSGLYEAAPPPAVEPGPLPAPVGVLTVAAMFDLVNWRNRPDEARPLPTIKPPPPPGAEFTVEAMMPMFGWE